jgi:hypothetical protein
MERTPIEARTFTNGNLTYVYDLELIEMEQGWNANAVMDFHIEQTQAEHKTFDQLVQSGGLEWFHKCASALLIRKDGEEYLPFSPIGWREAELFVRKLKWNQFNSLKECVEDFFTSSGGGQKSSLAFTNRSNSAGMRMLLELARTYTPKSSEEK